MLELKEQSMGDVGVAHINNTDVSSTVGRKHALGRESFIQGVFTSLRK
jgi:hypothetical protein